MVSTDKCAQSEISLHRLRLYVRLGWGDLERANLQAVTFDVKMRFLTLPQACLSDHLQETVCYDQFTQIIKEVCASGEFHLIEHLGWRVFQAVKNKLPSSIQLWIRTTKEHPPIAELLGGASFSLGDWIENSHP